MSPEEEHVGIRIELPAGPVQEMKEQNLGNNFVAKITSVCDGVASVVIYDTSGTTRKAVTGALQFTLSDNRRWYRHERPAAMTRPPAKTASK